MTLGRQVRLSRSNYYVTITKEETSELWKVVKERQSNKRDVGVRDERKSSRLGSEEIEYVGLAGEYAVGKTLRLPVSFDTGAKGDGGFGDLTFHDGRTIAVKTATTIGGSYNLRGDDVELMYDDIQILCSLPVHITGMTHNIKLHMDQKVRIVGYMERPDFLRHAQVKESDTGRYLSVHPNHFYPVQDLIDITERMGL